MNQPDRSFPQSVPTQQNFGQMPIPQQRAMPAGNPLTKHFRQPALYIKLTSEGAFWPDGSLELTATGEIPVYPMTAKDEIILRTPDALINGTSVVQVIQSCCPNIKDAWQMPSVDVDSTLIAIRIASYGATMSVTATCPHCNEEHDYDINLQQVRDRVRSPNYNDVVQTNDGLAIHLKPLNYHQISKAGSASLEEERIIRAIADNEKDEKTKVEEYSFHMKKMVDINIDNVTACTAAIVTPEETVTDVNFIREYYQNADGGVLKKVKDKMQEFNDIVSLKPEEATCTACNKNFKLAVEFDYAHFFASGF